MWVCVGYEKVYWFGGSGGMVVLFFILINFVKVVGVWFFFFNGM